VIDGSRLTFLLGNFSQKRMQEIADALRTILEL
jgi:mRNA-degrading endonuclease toxin of MazEF toxin-antitoxin module